MLHAIGDRAIRTGLDAIEGMIHANGPRERRTSVEHIEIISPDDLDRFAALDVVASMQPLHSEPDDVFLGTWARMVGEDRLSDAFRWRTIEKTGARVAFGSDWATVSANPLEHLFVAVTREPRRGRALEGWDRSERVSLENALLHYTIDGAYAAFHDDVSGSIELGKSADLVVLSRDIFEGSPRDILETEVSLTMLSGRIVYRSER